MPGTGAPHGGVGGPFLYMVAMLPLMRWMAREYPQLARTRHTSPPQAYVDDAGPMARETKAQQVVQDLMQRYGWDNHLVWSTEKSAVLRRGGEGGMALDVGDGVAWLEAVVLGYVQVMGAEGIRLPDKLVSLFRAMMVVLRNHPPSVQTTLYYLRAVLNAAIGYQGMHLSYWRGQLEEVESEVRRLIRGYEGIPTEVPRCVLRLLTAYYGEGMPTAGEAYRAHTARALNRMRHNQEEMVRVMKSSSQLQSQFMCSHRKYFRDHFWCRPDRRARHAFARPFGCAHCRPVHSRCWNCGNRIRFDYLGITNFITRGRVCLVVYMLLHTLRCL